MKYNFRNQSFFFLQEDSDPTVHESLSIENTLWASTVVASGKKKMRSLGTCAKKKYFIFTFLFIFFLLTFFNPSFFF